MKLYFSSGSCRIAAQIVLREAGQAFELVNVDPGATAAFDVDYRAITQKCILPALQLDSGDLLAESAVILQWVADMHPHCEFLPRPGSKERYLALAWLNFIATELHKGVAVMFSPMLDQVSKARFADGNLAPICAYIDAHLANNPYLMGQKLSIADAYLYDVMSWPVRAKIDVSEYISIQRFMARMEQKWSVRASLAAVGISVVY